jgi:hypothetical protein
MRRAADRAPEVHTASDAREVALELTSTTLHFGLGHRSSLYFERSRPGHCVEYAELFAGLFNELASRAQLAARAWVVRSEPTRLLWLSPRSRFLRDHDWNLIRDVSERHYVDAAFADMWLGAEVRPNVEGRVQ